MGKFQPIDIKLSKLDPHAYSHEMALLYQRHIAEKVARFQTILNATDYHELVIGSGETKMQFQDDMAYSFKANPYFREWVPLATRAGCYLQITRDLEKPRLFLLAVEDIWHTASESLPAGFEQAFEVIEYSSIEEVKKFLIDEATAFINETNELGVVAEHWNPQAVLHQIDYQRRGKTLYEQESVREANRRIEAITKADLDALAKAYLGRERASRVTVLPGKG